MGWWKRLKAWQKAGVIVGSTHLVVYMLILFLIFLKVLHSEIGWLLWLMELPWTSVLGIFQLELVFGPTLFTDMFGRGVVGTLIYAFFAMGVGWLSSIITAQISYKK